MIIPGTGPPQEIDLGEIHPQDCEECGQEQPFRLRFSYRYDHLFFVFGMMRARSYLVVCDVCQTPYRIPPEMARRLKPMGPDPVPFMHRYGCLVLCGIVSVLALIGMAVDAFQGE
jgi:hypothetical protein